MCLISKNIQTIIKEKQEESHSEKTTTNTVLIEPER